MLENKLVYLNWIIVGVIFSRLTRRNRFFFFFLSSIYYRAGLDFGENWAPAVVYIIVKNIVDFYFPTRDINTNARTHACMQACSQVRKLLQLTGQLHVKKSRKGDRNILARFCSHPLALYCTGKKYYRN